MNLYRLDKIEMAKKSIVARQLKRKRLFEKHRKKRRKLLELMKKSLSFKDRLILQKKLAKLPRDSAESRLKNRCWRTGRSRSFNGDFGLSRHSLREMAHEGFLPGVVKSSW